MIEIILGGMVILGIILLFVVIIHNKFQLAIIKIEEAENNIDMLLHKKLDLLGRTSPIIKKELKLDNFLDDLVEKSSDNVNLFELNSLLQDSYNTFLRTLDDNEKLFKSDALATIIDDIGENEIDLVAAIKYYNDGVVGFNKLVSSFPSCCFAFLRGYKKKDFYKDEEKEISDILCDD